MRIPMGVLMRGANSIKKSVNVSLSQDILEANAVSLNNLVEHAVLQSGEAPKDDGVQIEIVGEAINQDQLNPPKLAKTVKVQK